MGPTFTGTKVSFNHFLNYFNATMISNEMLYPSGILAIKGVDEKFIFQGVGMLFNGNISDQKWDKPA